MNVDKATLEKLYWNDSLSPYDIGKILKCSFSTVKNRMDEFNIPTRSNSAARLKYPRKSFDGDELKKAYMCGFRLGDLSVYKPKGKSETIVARCHTTQKTQVDVINKVFEPFGKVSVSNNIPGHFQVNCYLDTSFEFLLDKKFDDGEWLTQNPESGWAFISGYTDAEGNYIINQGRARFKIDSYDKEILEWMSKWLTLNNIRNKLRCLYKKGTARYVEKKKTLESIGWKYDLWRLNVNHKQDLREFILKTLPYSLHGKRVSDARTCLENIEKRSK